MKWQTDTGDRLQIYIRTQLGTGWILRLQSWRKKYDLTEAENEVLRTHQQNLRIVIGALILVIVVIVIAMNALRLRRMARLKLMNAEYKMQQQELQAK